MNNKKLLYSGKAKEIYEADNKDEVLVYYKDDMTAFNGVKKELINDKGILNCYISSQIYEFLESQGVATHLVKTVDNRTQLCKKVKVIPLEFICRNEIYGSMSKRLGIKKGTKSSEPILEICYKNDELNDPLINDYHAKALNIITKEQLSYVYNQVKIINELLEQFLNKIDIHLIDFKVEFGITSDNKIILCDEISPDSCRLMDLKTNKQLDKDLFRLNIGDTHDSYLEVARRIGFHE